MLTQTSHSFEVYKTCKAFRLFAVVIRILSVCILESKRRIHFKIVHVIDFCN